jgi:hypothetical protein
VDLDSSSAPLREGYDDKVMCTDEADILIRTRDPLISTILKIMIPMRALFIIPLVSRRVMVRLPWKKGKEKISLLLVMHMTPWPLAAKSLIKCLLMKKLSAFSKKLGL